MPPVRSRIVAFDNGPVETVVTLARHQGPRGEILLRRRVANAETVEELIVNGVFAMDSSNVSSERRLADLALTGRAAGGRVLVGGLGLGYTAARLSGRAQIEVVEIEQCLIDWAYAGLTPTLRALATDPTVRLRHADLREVLTEDAPPRGPWDAILLDVDNGPDFLIHAANEELYAEAGLRSAYAQLNDSGICAIWCQGQSSSLLETLRSISPEVATHVLPRQGQSRLPPDVIYTMTKASGAR